jgi:hypothetical protein
VRTYKTDKIYGYIEGLCVEFEIILGYDAVISQKTLIFIDNTKNFKYTVHYKLPREYTRALSASTASCVKKIILINTVKILIPRFCIIIDGLLVDGPAWEGGGVSGAVRVVVDCSRTRRLPLVGATYRPATAYRLTA